MAVQRSPMDRVCVVMVSALGDSVHVLPVIAALKRHNPRTRISWVLQSGPASLVAGHPLVDEIIPFEYASGIAGVAGFAAVRRELARRDFDLVLDLQVSLKAGLITSFSRAPVKLGFDRARARDANWLFTTHRVPPHARQHVQDQYFEFLQYLGIPHEPVEWGLGPTQHERAVQRDFLQQFARPVAAITCGTSDADRDWFPERWAAVCDALHTDFGLQPVLVGAPTDRERATAAAIRQRVRASDPFDALGRGGVRGLVGILDHASLVISLDSAPMHISVALGTPVIALMSQADPKRTGPYRRFHDLIVNAFAEPGDAPDEVLWVRRRGRMGRIAVADVLERVERWRTRYAALPHSGQRADDQ